MSFIKLFGTTKLEAVLCPCCGKPTEHDRGPIDLQLRLGPKSIKSPAPSSTGDMQEWQFMGLELHVTLEKVKDAAFKIDGKNAYFCRDCVKRLLES